MKHRIPVLLSATVLAASLSTTAGSQELQGSTALPQYDPLPNAKAQPITRKALMRVEALSGYKEPRWISNTVAKGLRIPL